MASSMTSIAAAPGRLCAEGEITLPCGSWGADVERRLMVLRVWDGSLVDQGVQSGDCLLVDPRGRLEEGQTAALEIGGAVTVGRVVREADGPLRLMPAGPGQLPLGIPSAGVRVIGTIVGVFRRRVSRRANPGRRPTKPSGLREATLPMLGRAIKSAEHRVAEHPGPRSARLLELVRNLRGLRDCYLSTSTPRLREALLREALRLISRLRRFDIEPVASSA
jgi:hypothetical protein